MNLTFSVALRPSKGTTDFQFRVFFLTRESVYIHICTDKIFNSSTREKKNHQAMVPYF